MVTRHLLSAPPVRLFPADVIHCFTFSSDLFVVNCVLARSSSLLCSTNSWFSPEGRGSFRWSAAVPPCCLVLFQLPGGGVRFPWWWVVAKHGGLSQFCFGFYVFTFCDLQSLVSIEICSFAGCCSPATVSEFLEDVFVHYFRFVVCFCCR